MKRLGVQWLIAVMIVVVLGLSACTPEPPPEKIEPAVLEPLDDGRNLVSLTEKAAQRLDIQTDKVREEQILRKQSVGGEVMPEVGESGRAMVRVRLNGDEFALVDRSKPAMIMLLGDGDDDDDGEDNDEMDGLLGEPDEAPGLDDNEDEGGTALYFVVDNPEHSLIPGQRLIVQLSLKSDEMPKLFVPEAAVIYDVNGEAWVYISPEPLKFLRYPIVIEYIQDGIAVLLEGPPAGTEIVIVGVPELYGADTGVGK